MSMLAYRSRAQVRFDFQGSGRADLKNQIGCQSNGENAAASHVEMSIPTSRSARLVRMAQILDALPIASPYRASWCSRMSNFD